MCHCATLLDNKFFNSVTCFVTLVSTDKCETEFEGHVHSLAILYAVKDCSAKLQGHSRKQILTLIVSPESNLEAWNLGLGLTAWP